MASLQKGQTEKKSIQTKIYTHVSQHRHMLDIIDHPCRDQDVSSSIQRMDE